MISLRLRQPVDVPLEVEAITPEALAGRTAAEIERMPVFQGNREAALGDFFAVDIRAADAADLLRLEGSGLERVKHVGHGMRRGCIAIAGDAGMHLGAEMRGGTILVEGSVGDWAGAEMRGGLLHVRGSAGHLLGAAYRGSPKGMRGGTILVEGSAGNEAGAGMRRGLIAVAADVGDFAGVMALAGTIIVLGHLGIRPGAGLKRATVVAHGGGLGAPRAATGAGNGVPRLLPTFKLDCEYRPTWLGLYLRHLHDAGFPVPALSRVGLYRRYSGDLTELGKGEILLWTSP
jgi:formylmethanofuran dehydrogenase subunit C